ncbi:GDP-mannose 4,6-dehydratase [Thalassoglobus sp. JC818]|uniref:GDP-mannose 4,6-dehydratase n=1 Tax=Thalassoglobus sp. JC818 TaxID=3232136 RepID=UPI00345B4125
MARVALITGISGQDGLLLTGQLIRDGYVVHGTTRHCSTSHIERVRSYLISQHLTEAIDQQLKLVEVSLLDAEAVGNLVDEVAPDEIYHLAGQSRVGRSFEIPVETFEANTQSTMNLLEAVRQSKLTDKPRFLLAGSAEIFGGSDEQILSETSRYAPRSPYAASKLSAQMLVETYRESYGLFACTAILFNHESPLRSADFVTGKIVKGVARIALGLDQKLVLGNLGIGRDWGDASDTVEAMRLMLSASSPEDFVVATGEWRPLTEFLDVAFRVVGLDWRDYVESSSELYRPVDAPRLVGDASKIKAKLGWRPRSEFTEMVERMVKHHLIAERGSDCIE